MGKVIVLLCFAFLAMTLVMCQEEETSCVQKPSCENENDCCGKMCNTWVSPGVCTTAPSWVGQRPWARAPVAASGGASALAWPSWGWGGPWGKPWMRPWGGQEGAGWPWGGQEAGGWPWGGSRAASGAEWAPKEEPAK